MKNLPFGYLSIRFSCFSVSRCYIRTRNSNRLIKYLQQNEQLPSSYQLHLHRVLPANLLHNACMCGTIFDRVPLMN